MTGQTGHEDININDIWGRNNKENLSSKFNFVDSQQTLDLSKGPAVLKSLTMGYCLTYDKAVRNLTFDYIKTKHRFKA